MEEYEWILLQEFLEYRPEYLHTQNNNDQTQDLHGCLGFHQDSYLQSLIRYFQPNKVIQLDHLDVTSGEVKMFVN